MNAIRSGMKMWSDNTCITFRERRGNERSYAYFQGGGGQAIPIRINLLCFSACAHVIAVYPVTLIHYLYEKPQIWDKNMPDIFVHGNHLI